MLAGLLTQPYASTGTPSLVSPNVTPGVPFATPRTRRTSQVIECLSRIPTVQVGEWF